jgi:hypothetical protein
MTNNIPDIFSFTLDVGYTRAFISRYAVWKYTAFALTLNSAILKARQTGKMHRASTASICMGANLARPNATPASDYDVFRFGVVCEIGRIADHYPLDLQG